VARHKIETTGQPVKLIAEPDLSAPSSWKADGQDLMHVRVMAVDKKGRRVQTTAEDVTFDVEGNATIVGVINGDINSDEMTVGNHRKLYNGTCSVILRSTRQAGPVVLKAHAQGMKEVRLSLSTQ